MYHRDMNSEELREEDFLLLPTQSDTRTGEMTATHLTPQDTLGEGEPSTTVGEAAAANSISREVSAERSLRFEDLFGSHFFFNEKAPIVDPSLLDSQKLMHYLFEDSTSDDNADVIANHRETLRRELESVKERAISNQLHHLFGEEGAAIIGSGECKPFSCLIASLPEKQDVGPYEEMWLTDMPKIAPNRQTLHMEPRPFLPSSFTTPPKNTERNLYTTQNVIRWSWSRNEKFFVSNARIVRWSDGSITLQGGSDSFPLRVSKESALTMLASPSTVSKDDVTLPALVSVVNPDKHFIVECSNAASIEKAVNEENQKIWSAPAQHNLAYSLPTLPVVNWNNLTASGTPQGEFIAREYRARWKMMEQRRNSGVPMTLTEQLQMESELFEKLQNLDVKELLEQQREHEREATLHSLTRQNHSTRRHRLERNVNLEGGEYSRVRNDTHINGGSDNEDDDGEGEEDDYEALLEGVRRKRQREDDEADEEHVRRIRRYEQERAEKYKELIDCLQDILSQLSESSSSRSSVEETLEFIRAGSFSPAVILKEVPLVLEEVTSECSNAAIERAREELRKLNEDK